jgi:hypothetical protein
MSLGTVFLLLGRTSLCVADSLPELGQMPWCQIIFLQNSGLALTEAMAMCTTRR